ncbi:MAG TPA: bifunctional DedA family/phosphatase PAP2 family protein [Gemmatimonadaceae bacterium]|nr:bifunctional DedA family/phosphatase PAP2 family protein [Gemmatimonadaceae bacterium]
MSDHFHILQLLVHYGYAILALFLLGEGVAIPFPTDTTVVTASALAARGQLSLALVFAVATTATFVGTTAGFFIGRAGSPWLRRFVHHDGGGGRGEVTLERAHAFVARHGTSAVIFSRFIPFLRMIICPVAGLSGMGARRFWLANAAGAVIWSATFCAIGYFFGHHSRAFFRELARAGLVVGFGLAAVVTVVVAGGWLVEDSSAAWRAEGTLWHRVLMSTPVRWLARWSPRAQTILFRRLTPGDYLGLNLTLGLGVSFVALLVFGALVDAVASRQGITRVDLILARALGAGATPTVLALCDAARSLGTRQAAVALGLVTGAVLALRRSWLLLAGWSAALAGTGILNAALQHALHRPRRLLLPAPAESSFSFPSGHALGTLVVYGMLAYLLVLHLRSPLTRKLVVAALGALVLAVCASELFLGTSYFTDVAGGLAAGGVWLSAVVTGLEVARLKREGAARENELRAAHADRRAPHP